MAENHPENPQKTPREIIAALLKSAAEPGEENHAIQRLLAPREPAQEPAGQSPMAQADLGVKALISQDNSLRGTSLPVSINGEFHGIHMGVLTDHTTYFSQRGLAALCGVDESTIRQHARQWADGKRDGALARLLLENQFTDQSLSMGRVPGRHAGTQELVYSECVSTTFAEYYAKVADKTTQEAKAAHTTFKLAGMRTFVHHETGYMPPVRPDHPDQTYSTVPDGHPFKPLLDRIDTNRPPRGFFSIFQEVKPLLMDLYHAGISIDEKTIPDISVGNTWGRHWVDNGPGQGRTLDATYGGRIKYPHNYPVYFPQAPSNPQMVWIYPDAALPAFRAWFYDVYIPKLFPKYVHRSKMPSDLAQRVLAAVKSPDPLPKQLN